MIGEIVVEEIGCWGSCCWGNCCWGNWLLGKLMLGKMSRGSCDWGSCANLTPKFPCIIIEGLQFGFGELY